MQFELPCECGRRLIVTAGDAGATLRCECGRTVQVPGLNELRASVPALTDDTPRHPPPTRSAQLTGVDLAVCVLLPLVGFIAGVLRLLRRNPTGGRMMAVSGCVLVVGVLLGFLGR